MFDPRRPRGRRRPCRRGRRRSARRAWRVRAAVLVVGIGVDDHVGAELQGRVDAGLEGGREALVVGQAHDVVDAVRARDRDRVVGRAVVDDEPLDLVEARQPRAGGRRASAGSCSASLKQGIWMISFIGRCDLPRLARTQYPKAQDVVFALQSPPRRRRGCGARIGRQMESATLTRRRPGPTRPARCARGCARRRGCGSRSRSLCVAALVGYLAFPTYPTYDSFYALLWGRDLLHAAPARLPGLPGSYRAPTGDRLRDALLALRPGRRAPDGARLDRLVRGGRGRCLPARAAVLPPARRPSRRC